MSLPLFNKLNKELTDVANEILGNIKDIDCEDKIEKDFKKNKKSLIIRTGKQLDEFISQKQLKGVGGMERTFFATYSINLQLSLIEENVDGMIHQLGNTLRSHMPQYTHTQATFLIGLILCN